MALIHDVEKEGFQRGGEPSQGVNAELRQKTQADTPAATRAAPGGKAAQGQELGPDVRPDLSPGEEPLGRRQLLNLPET